MQVKDIMTADPACCTPECSLADVAKMMVENDCGEIPIVDGKESRMPIGVITDRDIVCRSIAKGLNPLEMQVEELMTSPIVSISHTASLDECYRLLEDNQIRRIPVIDEAGRCCGIVALADIAERVSQGDSGEVLRYVSAATGSSSSVV